MKSQKNRIKKSWLKQSETKQNIKNKTTNKTPINVPDCNKTSNVVYDSGWIQVSDTLGDLFKVDVPLYTTIKNGEIYTRVNLAVASNISHVFSVLDKKGYPDSSDSVEKTDEKIKHLLADTDLQILVKQKEHTQATPTTFIENPVSYKWGQELTITYNGDLVCKGKPEEIDSYQHRYGEEALAKLNIQNYDNPFYMHANVPGKTAIGQVAGVWIEKQTSNTELCYWVADFEWSPHVSADNHRIIDLTPEFITFKGYKNVWTREWKYYEERETWAWTPWEFSHTEYNVIFSGYFSEQGLVSFSVWSPVFNQYITVLALSHTIIETRKEEFYWAYLDSKKRWRVKITKAAPGCGEPMRYYISKKSSKGEGTVNLLIKAIKEKREEKFVFSKGWWNTWVKDENKKYIPAIAGEFLIKEKAIIQRDNPVRIFTQSINQYLGESSGIYPFDEIFVETIEKPVYIPAGDVEVRLRIINNNTTIYHEVPKYKE